MHPVLDVAARGQHQRREVLAPGPQARQHFETIHARQTDIEDRHRVFLAAQGQVGRHAVVQHIHGQPGALERLGDTFEVPGKRTVKDLLAGQLRFLAKIGGPFAVSAPESAQGLGAFRVVLQQRQLVHEFITGGAVDGPVAVQGFAFAEDLLDEDRQVPLR
ncbi:hypothetical protein PS876_05251 [Pseudomonas fluorescens]|nr:hypothetical protein PS876_05251 [Pseudomonas fluorescens]